MNTYDTSEFLAKAKLAMADSWYREGGARGMAQAEAEYKDFILFYKSMEEAAEAQMKICKMQYDQMDRADRDPHHALRAQDECKQLLLEFPNSKHSVEAEQYLRNVQEILADEEFKVQTFYAKKGSFPASTNRGQALTDQFPLYSNAADALWMLADGYQHLGDRFENQQAEAYSQIAREHPLSPHFEAAKLRLQAMGKPVPEVDPVAYAREVFEADNKIKRPFMTRMWAPFGSSPDTTVAARTGVPSTEPFHPTIPVSVPITAAGTQGTSANPTPTVTGGAAGDANVTGSVVKDTNLIDTAPDARTLAKPDATAPATAVPAAPGAPASGAAVTGTQLPAPVPGAATPAPGVAAPAQPQTGATSPPTLPNSKTKSLAQQEADLKREQDLMKKEKAKNLEVQKKRYEEMQRMAKKQQAAQEKRKAQEDADAKKAQEAAAKKAKKQAPKTTPAAAPTQPDKQPDKPAGSGGGDTPSAKQ
jgi:outer membrane protein assembly factor BamD